MVQFCILGCFWFYVHTGTHWNISLLRLKTLYVDLLCDSWSCDSDSMMFIRSLTMSTLNTWHVTEDWGADRVKSGADDAESDWKLVVSWVTFPGSSGCICCSDSSFYLQHNFKKHNTTCSTTSLLSLMAVRPFYLSPPSVNHLMLSLSLSLRPQTPTDLQLCSHKAAVFLSHQLIAVNCIHLLAPVWISL